MRTRFGMTNHFHPCGASLRRLIFSLTLTLLGACGSGNDDDAANDAPAPGVSPPVVSTVQMSGLAVDGPLRDATVVIFEADGDQIAQTTTDSVGRFRVDLLETVLYPLTVRVTGGTDTVSNAPASIELAGIINSPGQAMLLTPFSTLAVRRAECVASNAGTDPLAARNALTNASVDTLLGTALSFGLHSGVRSQLLSTIPSDPGQAASLLYSSEQMVEVLRRVSQQLTGSTPNQVLTVIACDSVNGAIDANEVGSSIRTAALFQLIAAEVMLEAASGQLRVGGQTANSRLDAALVGTFNINTSSVSTLTIDAATLTNLKRLVNAANVAQPGADLLQLNNALNGLTAPVSAVNVAAALGALVNPSPLRALIEAAVMPSSALLTALQSTEPVPIISMLTATPTILASAAGGVTTLQWSAQNASSCVRSGAGLGWNGTGGTSGTISDVGPVVVNSTFTITCTGPGGAATASVDVFVPPAISLLTATPSIVASAAGGVTALQWSAQNASSCERTGAGLGWNGTGGTSGTISNVGTVVVNSTFTITCTGPGGTATASVDVFVPPAINVLTATPSIMASAAGGVTTLQWSAQNASSCERTGGWSGTGGTSGTISDVGPVVVNSTFTITCTGPGGTATASVDVYVPPAISLLTATPSIVASAAGGVTALQWTSQNASSCERTGAGLGWNGTGGTSGTISNVGPVVVNSTFTITCTGPGGTATASVDVYVPPGISALTATPSIVASAAGGVTSLQWSAQNASSCERTGAGLGWNGTGGTSGTISNVGPVVVNSTFTITCTGLGGTATASVDVYVPPGVEISFSPSTADLNETVTVTITSTNTTSCNSTLTEGSGGQVGITSGGTFSADVGNSVNVTCSGLGGTAIAGKSLPVRAARLTWVAPTLNEGGSAVSLEGFKVYHGTTAGSRSEVIDIIDPGASEYTGAFPTGTRFFEVTAISNGGLESRFSNEASKIIP